MMIFMNIVNVFFRKLADGLFLECCRKVSEEYPDIEFEAMIVDNCSMQVIKCSFFSWHFLSVF